MVHRRPVMAYTRGENPHATSARGSYNSPTHNPYDRKAHAGTQRQSQRYIYMHRVRYIVGATCRDETPRPHAGRPRPADSACTEPRHCPRQAGSDAAPRRRRNLNVIRPPSCLHLLACMPHCVTGTIEAIKSRRMFPAPELSPALRPKAPSMPLPPSSRGSWSRVLVMRMGLPSCTC
jgi:hypothetical protein